jgi:DNA-binding Lrp family transcriptional regulator
MKAYVNVGTKPGTAVEFVQRMRKENKDIISADAIFGRFDAILVLEVPEISDIDRVVYGIIQSNPNVTHTETSIVIGLRNL